MDRVDRLLQGLAAGILGVLLTLVLTFGFARIAMIALISGLGEFWLYWAFVLLVFAVSFSLGARHGIDGFFRILSWPFRKVQEILNG